MKFTRCFAALLMFGLLGPLGLAAAQASGLCTQLPLSLQNIAVNGITNAEQLQKVDEQLDAYLQACLEQPNAKNTRSICDNARVVAEQVLRVIGRMDTAGKHNAFLSNAKPKSYKTAIALLEKRKKLTTDHVCLHE